VYFRACPNWKPAYSVWGWCPLQELNPNPLAYFPYGTCQRANHYTTGGVWCRGADSNGVSFVKVCHHSTPAACAPEFLRPKGDTLFTLTK